MLSTFRTCLTVAVCLTLSLGFAAGQARIDESGRPLLLKDDGGGNWQRPTLVYSDAVEEVYVPDMTDPAWVRHAWNEIGAMNDSFTIAMYTFLRNTRGLKEDIVEIDLRHNIAVVYEPTGKTTSEVSLIDHPPLFARIINSKIRPFVTKEILAYNRAIWGLGPNPIDSVGIFSEANSLSGPATPKSDSPPVPVERPSAMGSPSVTTGTYDAIGSVYPPVLIHAVDPEWSEEARKHKRGGSVIVGLTVDERGYPKNLHLIKGLDNDMGLNQKAIEAAREYRFKPAQKNGRPVPFDLDIEVDYQTF